MNPEKSRKFNPDRLRASGAILERILRDPSLAPRAATFALVGSNGKGSTAFFLAQIARALDPRRPVGLFTSPHLRSVLERIRVNGRPISARTALRSLDIVRAASGADWEHLSYFELTTLMACAVFLERDCGATIFEAGLGGRWDATRAVQAENVLLLPIELEHTALLGETHERILAEKLAILSPRARRLFVFQQPHCSADLVRTTAAGFAPAALETFFFAREAGDSGADVNYLETNARFARFCYERVTGQAASHVLLRQPPGRLEIHDTPLRGRSGQAVRLIFDPAHNEPGYAVTLGSLGAMGLEVRKGLVLLAQLPDRELAGALRLFREAGTTCRVLTADFLAVPGAPDRASSLELARVLEEVPALLRGSDFSFCAFLGTHRTHQVFRKLWRKMRGG